MQSAALIILGMLFACAMLPITDTPTQVTLPQEANRPAVLTVVLEFCRTFARTMTQCARSACRAMT